MGEQNKKKMRRREIEKLDGLLQQFVCRKK